MCITDQALKRYRKYVMKSAHPIRTPGSNLKGLAHRLVQFHTCVIYKYVLVTVMSFDTGAHDCTLLEVMVHNGQTL